MKLSYRAWAEFIERHHRRILLGSLALTDEELEMVKTRAKAGLIRSLASNRGIASQLTQYQAMFGDWRELFRSVERIEQVTQEDILRVARETFVSTRRTVAMIVHEEAGP